MSNFLYSVEREYPVTIDALWHAWADAEALQAWYCPTDLRVLAGSSVSEPHVGGTWATVVEVPEHNATACFYGVYTDVELHKRLAHTMQFTMNLEEFNSRVAGPSHEVVVEFEDRGGASWVKFSQFGELPEGEAPRAQAGMESYLDNLGKYLGTN